MNLSQNTISENQMSSNFSTVFDYTSSSGSRFQLTLINNAFVSTTCAYLDTTMLLPENQSLRQVLEESISKNVTGIESITVKSKYRLYIHKGNCFDWGNIVVQVIEVLEKTLEQKEKLGECQIFC